MKKIAIAFVSVAVLAFGSFQGLTWWKSQKEVKLKIETESDAALAAAGIPLNCKNKDKCIIVYIAPWCGVCVSTEPTFHAFHKYLPKLRPHYGFGLVVGAGSPAENAHKRDELQPIEAYVDDSRQLMRNHNVDAFPTWITVDKKGQIIQRKSGGFQVTSENTVEQALQEVLNL